MSIKSSLQRIRKNILDEKETKKVARIATYATLGIIAIVMTVLNIITDKGLLTWATGIFAVLCGINLLLILAGKKSEEFASVLFSIELTVMFTYFLISGSPEGFSALWITVLPFGSMIFYDRKRASIFCVVILVITTLLLNVPYFVENILQHPEYYTPTFRVRFPIFFVACYLIAFFLETLRSHSYNELARINKIHEELSVRDQLTDLYNRTGMYSTIRHRHATKSYRKIGIVILDIDFFKTVNDTYGHSAGDKILRDMAMLMKQHINAVITRWGGEEFAFVYYDDDVKYDDLENFRKTLADYVFEYDGKRISLTASMGVYETASHEIDNLDMWIRNADHALYRAKEDGRNRIVYF